MSRLKILTGHLRRLLARREPDDTKIRKIRDSHAFRQVAESERLRVYRSGTTLSIVIFEPASTEWDLTRLVRFDRELDAQLEPIDTAGFLADDRVGILLPGMSEEDARTWAENLCASHAPHDPRLTYELLVYPQRAKRFIEQDGLADLTGSEQVPFSSEAFFALALPRWKRAMDVAGTCVALIAASPVLLLAAVLIKLTTRGPVLFGQEREGWGGRRFLMYKLRTMIHGSEALVQELRPSTEQDGPAFKMSCDPRVTTVGRILRRFSIDELPQLFNVLIGDMSLVGPRPLPTAESLSCELWQRRRLDVTPGMTGIWQVRGRNQVSFDQWMQMDIEYVSKRSLRQDLSVLLATIPAVVFCRGAQ